MVYSEQGHDKLLALSSGTGEPDGKLRSGTQAAPEKAWGLGMCRVCTPLHNLTWSLLSHPTLEFSGIRGFLPNHRDGAKL